jgi:Fe-S-cluster containining protein
MVDKPWYHEGLRFECTHCGTCCSGAPGFVWVNDEEIASIAEEIGQEQQAFEAAYVRKIGIRKSLREFPNGDCVFLNAETRTCRVYPVRPRQCHTWPFWESNLKTADEWTRICRSCPGAGRGPRHKLAEIEAARTLMKI